jgi:hypothetical protein
MAMEIPNTFKLFNQMWSIRSAQPKELENNDLLGMCYPETNEILLNPSQTPDSIAHTLLHELIHSIESKLHLSLTEQQVDLLALGLLDLYRSNPNMLHLLGPLYTPKTTTEQEDLNEVYDSFTQAENT